MAEVECPVEGGCDYAGSVKSVEGHISASTEGDHQGEAGANFREELRKQAEAVAEAGREGASEVADAAREDVGSSAGSFLAGPAVAGATLLGSDDGEFPVELVVVGVVLVALLLVSRGDNEPERTEDRGGAEGGVVGGGLA